MSEPCWRCGGNMVDFQNGLGVHCLQCSRTPDREYHEEIERAKGRQKGNPKTYGGSGYSRHRPDLEGFAMSKMAKMCRG